MLTVNDIQNGLHIKFKWINRFRKIMWYWGIIVGLLKLVTKVIEADSQIFVRTNEDAVKLMLRGEIVGKLSTLPSWLAFVL